MQASIILERERMMKLAQELHWLMLFCQSKSVQINHAIRVVEDLFRPQIADSQVCSMRLFLVCLVTSEETSSERGL